MNWENADSQKDQAFSDLLRSMWNEEDEDNEAVEGDEGQDEEKAAEGDDDLTAGDGEICEEKVNEEELEEIYEFAATQRKRDEETASMSEQEDNENEFTKLTEPNKTCEPLKTTNTDPIVESDPNLDRSYSSLFSDSLGDCEEGDLLSPSCSAPIPQTPKSESCQKSSPKPSGRTLLQSSASTVEDASLRVPQTTSLLPVPGESPGQQQNCEPEQGFLLKHQSPCGVSINGSPDKPQENQKPELIVLSDSNSPSPENYTRIRPLPNRIQSSPDCPLDCSPELSWLIPSTPLQRATSTTSSSTQTRSSICRMQLFPNRDASAPSFSSPDFTVKSHVQVNLKRTAPHSSTPLHSDVQKPPVPPGSSLHRRSFDEQRSKSEGVEQRPSEKLSSFHLSTDPPDSPSSSFHEGFQNSQRQGDLQCQSQPSSQFCTREGPESDVRRSGIIGEERENKDEEQHEGAAPSGFGQSFMDMDEPPIAFNDSWGLDVCADAEPGCFSLRLEDSSACSQQERPRGHRDAAPSASQSRLSPPNHHACSSSPEAHRPQPAPHLQAHTDSSPHGSIGRTPPQLSTSLLDSKIWDSWEEEEDDALPLSQRVNPSARLKTPGENPSFLHTVMMISAYTSTL